MKLPIIFIIICSTLLLSCDGIEDNIVNIDDIISIQLVNENGEELNESLVGDGESVIKIMAQIPPDTNEKYRTIKFKASGGTFTGISSDASSQKANLEGIAQANLRLPLANKQLTIYVSAEISTDNQTFVAEEEFVINQIDEVIVVKMLNTDGTPIISDIEADGKTEVLIQAKVLVNSSLLSQITLETSGGSIIGGSGNKVTETTDSDAQVTALLKMPNVIDPITIIASAGSNPIYKDRITLQPTRSYPEAIFIEPQKISMKIQESNAIKVFLKKDSGKVTQNLPVSFQSYQKLNEALVPVGRFTGLQNAKSDANGELSVIFHTDTGDIDTSLSVVVLVETHIGDGTQLLTDSLEIDIQ